MGKLTHLEAFMSDDGKYDFIGMDDLTATDYELVEGGAP